MNFEGLCHHCSLPSEWYGHFFPSLSVYLSPRYGRVQEDQSEAFKFGDLFTISQQNPSLQLSPLPLLRLLLSPLVLLEFLRV